MLSRAITWDRAVDEYSALVEPGFDVQSTLTALQAGQLAREAQVVIELVRVREFVSREDALVAGARAAGTLTDGQYDTLTATIEDRRVFERTYVPDLPADSSGLFEEFQRGDLYRSLARGEDALLRAGAGRAGRPSRRTPGARPPTGPSSATCSCAPAPPRTPRRAAGPSPTTS
ncbi:nitrate- and nitrite sensing domain-containing protein [Streptomyces diastatochromogenes]|nr:nitrate- and nitrite sensing domain-containing protein [Streptomyces diastatochromogenes]